MSVVKLSLILAAAAWQDTPVDVAVPSVEEPPVQERGLASWYGDGNMHGRRTASGDLIDPTLHTCAHRTLPLQTTVLLVNGRDHTKRTWCRVNDRGPYGALDASGTYQVKISASDAGTWRGVLDISIAAAKELGTYQRGLEPIEIRYWRPGASERGLVALTRRRGK